MPHSGVFLVSSSFRRLDYPLPEGRNRPTPCREELRLRESPSLVLMFCAHQKPAQLVLGRRAPLMAGLPHTTICKPCVLAQTQSPHL